MWAKIGSALSGLKNIAVDKAKKSAIKKTVNSLSNSESAKSPVLTMALISIMTVLLIVISPILIISQAYGNMFVIQAAAPDNNGSEDNANESVTAGNILLIAGHSYAPYCNQVSNECREESGMASGYYEPDETRSLVKLIKTELQNLSVNVDVANELLAPGDSRMNSSFFVESTLNTTAFNSIDWKKYNYVLEVHFNGGGGSGPLLVKTSSNYSTDVDEKIIEAVTKNTGTSRNGDVIRSLNDMSYFQNLNIPMTYLETEFYDNKSAMDTYTSKKNQIAKDIALAIKDTYGKVVNVSGTRAEIVARAKAELGKPYVWGATGPDSYDCSGLVGYALTGSHERLGTTLTFWGWPETNNPLPGDIAVVDDGNGNGHTGLYIGDGQMVHASGSNSGVTIGPVQDNMKYVVYPDLKEDTPSSSSSNSSASSGTQLTSESGVFYGPEGKETYYNMDMSDVVAMAHSAGVSGDYWVRDDGVKMLGDYVMVAANLDVHPRYTYVNTSLGRGIVVDTGGFAAREPHTLDIATSWW